MEAIDPKLTLVGDLVRLEPLSRAHLDALLAAAAAGQYLDTASAWRDAGTALPFAIIRLGDGAFIGSTRFWEMERWNWPAGHPRHGSPLPDVCEIGYTWFTRSAIRTGANTEAKLLMLSHAFENWKVLRVCLHTDVRNARSQEAIKRVGAKFEGVLRAHRLAADHTPRDSARFSLLAEEWPQAKAKLLELRNRVRP